VKVLLIGYGSIGRRHEEVLLSFPEISTIDIVTRQTLPQKKIFKHLRDVENIGQYDYFVIASETHKHYEQLEYLENNLSNKLIFCEKPLFDTSKCLHVGKNNVFVGYVLRFHPLLQKLKQFLGNETVINVNVSCGSYLPTWRQNVDYRDSYSAKKEKGGGVLLDLSHEIDYVQWFFGKVIELKSYQLHISDLEIDSDDMVIFIGKTERGVLVNCSIDYISKITHRRMIVDTNDQSFELDFIQNRLIQKSRNGQEECYECPTLQRNEMFEQMHRSILGDKQKVCSFNEAQSVMDTIKIIQEQNR